MKKIKLVIALLFSVISMVSIAQEKLSNSHKSEADQYWETKPICYPPASGVTLPDKYNQKDFDRYIESKTEVNIYDELFRRTLREWGIRFWTLFPNDQRRFEWLVTSRLYEPAYFANVREGARAKAEKKYVVQLDTLAKNGWKILYCQYLKEFLSSNEVSEQRKEILFRQELSFGFFNKKWRNSKQEKFDLQQHVLQSVDFAKRYGAEGPVVNMLGVLYRDRNDFGLDDQDIDKYLALLKATEFSAFHQQARGIESVRKLYKIPLKLQTKSVDGKLVDLEKYKGKLVLVDFWSLGCTVCIEKMPEIKQVFDKYNSKGFEVISACISGYINEDKKKIEQIHQKTGANWPLAILDFRPGGLGRKIFDTYGWQGVPQLLLLDEEGKLLSSGSEFRTKGSLEKLVKQHLDKN
ncbi:TlpA family protein disulfide reductase [Pedobacter heparinus]|uniref:Redoxin domain protein n=1 Tax=Pedobacter heparinus (strain ATCC 13125 / DSM 2366 / CIP 104194 / JCM 7457 / NBRC 12017 / NCIMB 9290 / NRRL B-14731 / HIM 762-3) TaxID=485917 RepID=C6Y2R6_PEDHD|nr:TlpA disulfide reductase family protein [Pedobacter heparinus]ACU03129.1 Redoxin domain protein [Pedobacter heparinus DSM 2366]